MSTRAPSMRVPTCGTCLAAMTVLMSGAGLIETTSNASFAGAGAACWAAANGRKASSARTAQGTRAGKNFCITNTSALRFQFAAGRGNLRRRLVAFRDAGGRHSIHRRPLALVEVQESHLHVGRGEFEAELRGQRRPHARAGGIALAGGKARSDRAVGGAIGH